MAIFDGYFRQGAPESITAHGLLKQPGSDFTYSYANPALMTGILKQATGDSYAGYCDKHIFPVLGISRNEWHWLGDREGDSQPDGGSFQTARNYAKAAYLMLNNGQWVSRVIAAGIWVAFFQDCQQ